MVCSGIFPFAVHQICTSDVILVYVTYEQLLLRFHHVLRVSIVVLQKDYVVVNGKWYHPNRFLVELVLSVFVVDQVSHHDQLVVDQVGWQRTILIEYQCWEFESKWLFCLFETPDTDSVVCTAWQQPHSVFTDIDRPDRLEYLKRLDLFTTIDIDIPYLTILAAVGHSIAVGDCNRLDGCWSIHTILFLFGLDIPQYQLFVLTTWQNFTVIEESDTPDIELVASERQNKLSWLGIPDIYHFISTTSHYSIAARVETQTMDIATMCLNLFLDLLSVDIP